MRVYRKCFTENIYDTDDLVSRLKAATLQVSVESTSAEAPALTSCALTS
jgi:hypothetical protein